MSGFVGVYMCQTFIGVCESQVETATLVKSEDVKLDDDFTFLYTQKRTSIKTF